MSDPIVTFDEQAERYELRELVRKTVEDTLNTLLKEEADGLVKADRYERTAEREAYRAGHYERKLTMTSDEVTLKMPKLKGMRFATAIIERYRRREASEEKSLKKAAEDLEGMRLKEAAKVVREGYAETLAYSRFTMGH